MSEYFTEHLHEELLQQVRIDKVIYRDKTDLQDLIIFENSLFGRVLALDGVVQTTEGDEYVYHEMLTHVPITGHGAVKRVLIIGGGDGGMAREALKHEGVEVTMVEIDRSVVDLCSEYLPKLNNGAFENPRFNLVITDGCKFVKETEERWDVIIVDSTDPIGPGEVLFTEEFYADCKRCLSEGGILVTQNGCPAVQGSEVTDSFNRLRPSFGDVSFYLAPVPTYQGGFMAFGWASDNADLRRLPGDLLAARFDPKGIATRYYTPAVHAASFALPADVLSLLN